MNYTPLEVANFNQKDKRISFLSIFSSACLLHQGGKFDINELEDMAINATEKLYEKYPIIEIEKIEENTTPF
jgi:hypothetical protein